ncbi:hypothetical protein [Umezakia ovalisporum]|uniref:hypothetical protein n=1 Tax=Umezakia ovalisporum TaxID=75695 RepID=UPI002474F615|nr:hypothetical protein [Umezakia ovalisporum]MDH6083611.1 DUF4775 domain-containing protein [Umezakia ovalisporum TAC611]
MKNNNKRDNSLFALEQGLFGDKTSEKQSHQPTEKKKPKEPREEARAFDFDEAIEFQYDGDAFPTATPEVRSFSKSNSFASELEDESLPFEVEGFEVDKDVIPVSKPVTAKRETPVQREIVEDVTSQPKMQPVKATVVPSSEIPLKSAHPVKQSTTVEPTPSKEELSDAQAFAADLQAILNGEKTYDSEQKQVVPTSSIAPPAPAAPTPHPHDIFDKGQAAIPPQKPAEPVQMSRSHGVFDQMGKNLAHATNFDQGTVDLALEMRFDEFDRVLDREENRSLAEAKVSSESKPQVSSSPSLSKGLELSPDELKKHFLSKPQEFLERYPTYMKEGIKEGIVDILKRYPKDDIVCYKVKPYVDIMFNTLRCIPNTQIKTDTEIVELAFTNTKSNGDTGIRILPWEEDKITYCSLDNEAKWFFTGPLTGCHIYVGYDNDNTPFIFHANANTQNSSLDMNMMEKDKRMSKLIAKDGLFSNIKILHRLGRDEYRSEDKGFLAFAYGYKTMDEKSIDEKKPENPSWKFYVHCFEFDIDTKNVVNSVPVKIKFPSEEIVKHQLPKLYDEKLLAMASTYEDKKSSNELEKFKENPVKYLGCNKLKIQCKLPNDEGSSSTTIRVQEEEEIELIKIIPSNNIIDMYLNHERNGSFGFYESANDPKNNRKIKTYYLRWGNGKAYSVQLSNDNDVDYFLSAELNSCCVMINGSQENPTIIHANYNSQKLELHLPEDMPMQEKGAEMAKHQHRQYKLFYGNMAHKLIDEKVFDPKLPTSIFDPEFYMSGGGSHAAVFGIRKNRLWTFYYNLQKGNEFVTAELWPSFLGRLP